MLFSRYFFDQMGTLFLCLCGILFPKFSNYTPTKLTWNIMKPKKWSSDDVPFQRNIFQAERRSFSGCVCVYRRAIGPRCGHMSSVQGGSPNSKTDRKALGEPYIRDASSNGSFRVGYIGVYVCVNVHIYRYISIYFLFFNAHRIRLTLYH